MRARRVLFFLGLPIAFAVQDGPWTSLLRQHLSQEYDLVRQHVNATRGTRCSTPTWPLALQVHNEIMGQLMITVLAKREIVPRISKIMVAHEAHAIRNKVRAW